jgi:hypothetical protein
MFNIDFIGVGFPKCGTTWLTECLREHPEIALPNRKHLSFFNEVLDKSKTYSNSEVQKKYALFYNNYDGKVKGEFTENYVYDSSIPKTIKKNYPDVKIIIIIRNPIDRTYSNYYHELRENETKESFSNVIKDINNKYIRKSFYYESIKNYIETFDKTKILILKFDELKSDPWIFLSKVYDFLNVTDKSFRPSLLTIKKNEAFIPKSMFLHKITGYPFVMAKKLFRKKVGILIINTARFFKINNFLNYVHSDINIRNIDKKKLSVEIKHELLRIFNEDINKTEKLTGLNLKDWKSV